MQHVSLSESACGISREKLGNVAGALAANDALPPAPGSDCKIHKNSQPLIVFNLQTSEKFPTDNYTRSDSSRTKRLSLKCLSYFLIEIRPTMNFVLAVINVIAEPK